MENGHANDAQIIEAAARSKNNLHNNYQDSSLSSTHGGHIGLQHRSAPLRRTRSIHFSSAWKWCRCAHSQAGQVGVIKAYVGLATQDTSGADFNTVRSFVPAIAASGKRASDAPANIRSTRVATSESFQPAILTELADANSEAHISIALQQIVAKSKEASSSNRSGKSRFMSGHQSAPRHLHGRHHEELVT